MINPSTNKIAVIVLNWNGTEDTMACLNSLALQTYDNFEIIVIDNGSSRGQRDQLERFLAHFPFPTTYLKNEANRGFAGGVNTGIEAALSKDFSAVALFNNDAVADKEWLKSLAIELDRNEAAIITGALLHTDKKTIDSTGEFYSIWGLPFPRGRNESVTTLPKAGFIFGATGGASLYRSALFKDVGLFDQDFFAYYEDVDISFRAQLAGWRVYYTPKAIAYHKQGASSNKIPGFSVYQAFKNLPILFTKNTPRGMLVKIGLRFYCAYILMMLKAVVTGSGIPACKGVVASIRNSSRSFTKRRGIQKNIRVPREYLLSVIWPDLPPSQTGLRKFRKLFTGKS